MTLKEMSVMKCPECGGEVLEGIVAGTLVWTCDDCGWCLTGTEIERALIDEATGTIIPREKKSPNTPGFGVPTEE